MHRLLDAPGGAAAALKRLQPGTQLGFDLPVGGGDLRALRFDQDDAHRVELTLAGGRSPSTCSCARPRRAPW